MEEHLEEEAANQPFTTYFCQRKFFETRLRHRRKVLNTQNITKKFLILRSGIRQRFFEQGWEGLLGHLAFPPPHPHLTVHLSNFRFPIFMRVRSGRSFIPIRLREAYSILPERNQ